MAIEITEDLIEELVDLGDKKIAGDIDKTWDDIAAEMNAKHNVKKTESWWRKLYKSKRAKVETEENVESVLTDKMNEAAMKMQFESIELSEQRRAVNKQLKNDYRRDSLLKIFEDNIKKMDPPTVEPPKYEDSTKELVAMLSDIHYGITFKSIGGEYDSDIAAKRLKYYADSVCQFGIMEKAETVNVVIMGDLISGLIHRTLILENREDIVEQCCGVSRIIAAFLSTLSCGFSKINVYSVSGNHSRLDANMEECLRTERLDDLVMYMVKLELADYNSIKWHNNEDCSAVNFKVNGKNFVAVHGDYDKTTPLAVQRVGDIYGRVDYLLMAHMHVAESRFDKTTVIRNGCVCGSGDDYSMKKRLFAPPTQTVFAVGKYGVDDVRTVRL